MSLVSLMSFKSLMSLTSPTTAGLPKAVVDAKGQQKASLQEKIFGLSIFLFAQNLWHAVMKNGNLDSTLTAGEVSRRLTTSPTFSKEGFGVDCIYELRHVVNNYELNLPRIATQSILGLNRRRLGIVNIFTLRSTCSIFLCYTEC